VIAIVQKGGGVLFAIGQLLHHGISVQRRQILLHGQQIGHHRGSAIVVV